ncbi:MAG TPA: hypothetical protein VKD72_11070, partial [Gemmataceae bacterium]|nr:hypothetical protein [Gemmataceae bacterium]
VLVVRVDLFDPLMRWGWVWAPIFTVLSSGLWYCLAERFSSSSGAFILDVVLPTDLPTQAQAALRQDLARALGGHVLTRSDQIEDQGRPLVPPATPVRRFVTGLLVGLPAAIAWLAAFVVFEN